jgi:hypothetical protein
MSFAFSRGVRVESVEVRQSHISIRLIVVLSKVVYSAFTVMSDKAIRVTIAIRQVRVQFRYVRSCRRLRCRRFASREIRWLRYSCSNSYVSWNPL